MVAMTGSSSDPSRQEWGPLPRSQSGSILERVEVIFGVGRRLRIEYECDLIDRGRDSLRKRATGLPRDINIGESGGVTAGPAKLAA